MDDKYLLIGHLSQNDGWEPREIAEHLNLSIPTVERILRAVAESKILVREPEVDLNELMPELFDGS